MVRTIVSTPEYFVTIDAFDSNGDVVWTTKVEDLTFTGAADYFESAATYFRFAILDHSDWISIQVELNAPHAVVEIVEITRD